MATAFTWLVAVGIAWAIYNLTCIAWDMFGSLFFGRKG